MSVYKFRVLKDCLKCFGQRGIQTSCKSVHNVNSRFGDGQTHFGFETVTEEEKTDRVYEVFENVANSYDAMNDAMSVGIHRVWKDVFMQRLSPSFGTRLLDVGGGTGDIAFRFIKYLDNSKTIKAPESIKSHVTICDINKHMLDAGRIKAQAKGVFSTAEKINCSIDWLEANAEKLPLEDSSFSAYTVAFCLRNVTRMDKVLEEAYRVLRPGGRFLCLEFSHVENDAVRWFYDQYSFQLIPVMGHLITGQWKPYQYLVESIRQFPCQEEFKEMIEAAGFRLVTYENLTFGVVAIHSGFKL